MQNNDIKKLFSDSDPEKLMKNLSKDEQRLFNSLLNDKEARNKFLSSDEAQKILKMLYGG